MSYPADQRLCLISKRNAEVAAAGGAPHDVLVRPLERYRLEQRRLAVLDPTVRTAVVNCPSFRAVRLEAAFRVELTIALRVQRPQLFFQVRDLGKREAQPGLRCTGQLSGDLSQICFDLIHLA